MATVIGSIIVFGVFALIVGKDIYNRVHHKGGICSCGGDCTHCASCSGGCHSEK